MEKYEVSINEPFPFPVTVVVEAENRREALGKAYPEICVFTGVPVDFSRLKAKKVKGDKR